MLNLANVPAHLFGKKKKAKETKWNRKQKLEENPNKKDTAHSLQS